MKSFVSFLLVTVLSSISYAQTTELKCSFEGLSNTDKILIRVDGIAGEEKSPSLNYERYTDYEGHEAAFSYQGEDLEWLWDLTLSADGQSVELDEKGNMTFWLDSDGCDVGKIHLYGNNNYKYGYVSVEHRCSGDDVRTYSKAACDVIPVVDFEDVETPVDALLKNLKTTWENANVDATDHWSSAHKAEGVTIVAEVIHSLLDTEYVEYIDVSPYSGKRNETTAHGLAEGLFTADPYNNNPSLKDIKGVRTLLLKVLEQKDKYDIYVTSRSSDAFSASHSGLAIVSKETQEIVMLEAGYSE